MNCPICNKQIDLIADAERHVNECLDDQLAATFQHQQEQLKPSSNNKAAAEEWKSLFKRVRMKYGHSDGYGMSSASNYTTAECKSDDRPDYLTSVPACKRVPGTEIVVDHFLRFPLPSQAAVGNGNDRDRDKDIADEQAERNAAATARLKVRFPTYFFLTHYHADHYVGLPYLPPFSKRNSHLFNSTIYCSPLTAELLTAEMPGLDSTRLCSIPIGRPTQLYSNVSFEFIDANHCPGAVMIKFQVNDGKGNLFNYLHTGDFRYSARLHSPQQLHFPLAAGRRQSSQFNCIYLDTTYLNNRYRFANQSTIIERTVAACRLISRGAREISKLLSLPLEFLCPSIRNRTANNGTKKPLAIVVGSYTIGKERLFLSLAEALQCKIYAWDQRKRRILESVCRHQFPSSLELLTDSEDEALIHVCAMSNLSLRQAWLWEIMERYDRVLALRPTGWTFKSAVVSDGNSTGDGISGNSISGNVGSKRPREHSATNAQDLEKIYDSSSSSSSCDDNDDLEGQNSGWMRTTNYNIPPQRCQSPFHYSDKCDSIEQTMDEAAIKLLSMEDPKQLGLTYLPPSDPQLTERLALLNVNYSEHSSCAELEEFVKSVRAFNIMPTVAPKSTVAKRLLKQWTACADDKITN